MGDHPLSFHRAISFEKSGSGDTMIKKNSQLTDEIIKSNIWRELTRAIYESKKEDLQGKGINNPCTDLKRQKTDDIDHRNIRGGGNSKDKGIRIPYKGKYKGALWNVQALFMADDVEMYT